MESTWKPRLQVDSRWNLLCREASQNLVRFHLDSGWSPDGCRGIQMESTDSTPLHSPWNFILGGLCLNSTCNSHGLQVDNFDGLHLNSRLVWVKVEQMSLIVKKRLAREYSPLQLLRFLVSTSTPFHLHWLYVSYSLLIPFYYFYY